jgi:hypothetical protein
VVLRYAGIARDHDPALCSKALDHDLALCGIALDHESMLCGIDFALCGIALNHEPTLCGIAQDLDPALCDIVRDHDSALYRIVRGQNGITVERFAIHRTVNELPTRKMHASQNIFLGYIEIVYISTHIGIRIRLRRWPSAGDSYAASPKSSGSTVGMRGGR